jgi:hypothetical protein
MTETEAVELPDPAVDPAAYRAALLEVAADREPLDVIAQMPERVRALLDGVDPGALEWRPATGEWSAADILGHLLDDEIVNAFRLRLTLTADQPRYPGNDPDRWVALPKPPIAEVWQAWEGLRAYNLWLLRTIPRSQWTRVGLHDEQGPETVEVLILKNAGHDLAHISQLERWRTQLEHGHGVRANG